MLDAEVLAVLCCPVCQAEGLACETVEARPDGALTEGIAWCRVCRTWYPVEDGVLDLLVGDLAYREDRGRFRKRHDALFRRLELRDLKTGPESAELQGQQQKHFDWYAANETQSYLEYEQMPFLVAVDLVTFERWRPTLRPGGWLLDVGCGNGRSTSHVADLDLRVLGFDLARAAVRQAQQRFGDGGSRARVTFVAADATRFPVKTGAFDHVLVYGVLHHVPDPRVACAEIARVLKPGGRYIGSENNHTVFRPAFDLLQRLRPLWYEEAGPEALISAEVIREAFKGTGVGVSTRTHVFVPPHLVNLLPKGVGETVLRWSDRIGGALPGLRANGGLILIEGEKHAE